MSSKEAIHALSDYFTTYSKPVTIISDRGSNFTSHEFEKFLEEISVQHVLIATGSPQSNGQVERVNRVLTPMLGKLVNNDENKKWYQLLPEVEYALNNSVSKSTGETPSRLLFGINQRGCVDDRIKDYLDIDVNNKSRNLVEVRAKAAKKIAVAQEYNEGYFNKKHKKPNVYKEGDYIMLQNFDSTPGISKKIIPQYKGLYVIVKPLRNDRYIVSDIPGFQHEQTKYQGVWEPRNMRLWVKPSTG